MAKLHPKLKEPVEQPQQQADRSPLPSMPGRLGHPLVVVLGPPGCEYQRQSNYSHFHSSVISLLLTLFTMLFLCYFQCAL
ncbi:hypothetical protein BDM02DRAFT_3109948 [Thelephora ganbajun]|uniref:Uncharacterized protein n=1 Tax=Thelephora ganbajun TaxID=370292 RepID=A0ACB6ZQP6_THEGA|nr:hypothetical protein BDM02DRAFT_3109948 [Thelephora ganbajun]